jgi:hypothetical protein
LLLLLPPLAGELPASGLLKGDVAPLAAAAAGLCSCVPLLLLTDKLLAALNEKLALFPAAAAA